MVYAHIEEHGQVEVVLGNGDVMAQPDHFRICPLGIQFYSPSEVPEYVVLDLEIAVSDHDGSVLDLSCTGVVVLSRYESEYGLYRIWVMYVDLDDEKRNILTCTCKEKNLLCPHCMNF
jgi:hypothetical protein